MVKVTSKDKILDVVAVVDSESKEEETLVEETLEVEETKAEVGEGEVVQQKFTPPRHVVLSDLEYAAVSKTLNTITELKKNFTEDEPKSQINLLEMSIWDDLVKKFGFESVESAQSAGYSFGLKRIHVIESSKK